MTELTNPHTQSVKSWLASLGAALERADIAGALALFDDDCYWRDLVSFTWNIKTMEGKAQIADMLKATLASTKPTNWQIDGEGADGGGFSEAWFTFETSVSRGSGLVRLKGDKCWTLLTTMVELKGFEEPKAARASRGWSTAYNPAARAGSKSARPRRPASATRPNRTC